MAMTEDLVAGLQLIARRGAEGKDLKVFIKLNEVMERVFRNGHAHGKAHDHDQAPLPVRFIRAPEAPPPEPSTVEEPLGPEPPRRAVVVADGQEYVAVE